MKRVAVITPPDARDGFGLAGIPQYTTGEEEDAAGLLRKAVSDPDNGLIILDERLAREAGEDLLKNIDKTWPGVIVVLPMPAQPGAEMEDYALMLIRRAIGYHVRIRI